MGWQPSNYTIWFFSKSPFDHNVQLFDAAWEFPCNLNVLTRCWGYDDSAVSCWLGNYPAKTNGKPNQCLWINPHSEYLYLCDCIKFRHYTDGLQLCFLIVLYGMAVYPWVNCGSSLTLISRNWNPIGRYAKDSWQSHFNSGFGYHGRLYWFEKFV